MAHQRQTRRRVLRGITATGLTLGMIGTGSAQSSSTYVVTGGRRSRLENVGATITRELANKSVFIVSADDGAVDDLRSVSGVSGVTENFEVDHDGPISEAEPQTTGDADLTENQWDKEITDTFAAHDYATGAGTRIVIADTGVDGTHPDLEGNFNEELSVSFVDGGEKDDHIGDTGDHGTHVAGTAAATGAEGVTGTAPDAELISVRVLGEDSSTFADILAAVDYTAEISADVANYSLGAGPFPPEANSDGTRVAVQKVMQDVARRGTVSTVSAGNAATDLQRGGLFYLPGTVQGVLTISASGPSDNLSFYSNYGTSEIAVGAPGGGRATLEETAVPDDLVFSTEPDGTYGWKAGTSMAAPQVAGLVGLVRELEPDAHANQVENAIAHGAELVPGRSSPEFGAGRINALNTVTNL
ncbi:S8 family peptidase [Natrialba chahannaoensis]|nr:S8 family serine peptidase [Natrialba chahannaoensis]